MTVMAYLTLALVRGLALAFDLYGLTEPGVGTVTATSALSVNLRVNPGPHTPR